MPVTSFDSSLDVIVDAVMVPESKSDQAMRDRLIAREIAFMTRAKKTPDGRRIDWSRAPKSYRKRG